MSNQPKTPHRTVRIAADLWTRTQTKAADEGVTVSDVIRDALDDYVARPLQSLAAAEAERVKQLANLDALDALVAEIDMSTNDESAAQPE